MIMVRQQQGLLRVRTTVVMQHETALYSSGWTNMLDNFAEVWQGSQAARVGNTVELE